MAELPGAFGRIDINSGIEEYERALANISAFGCATPGGRMHDSEFSTIPSFFHSCLDLDFELQCVSVLPASALSFSALARQLEVDENKAENNYSRDAAVYDIGNG
ncbi:hypothetical protein EW145_g4870 [Phellinidium pouzarii]|uniref:Uncharacterized protein n=1 Tax=Phellinidium pouzarii TaxID=167371 RepID=A0A4S4L1Y2_9AGAM|nr:hypothetical protein EW145_g4870 [Phellinidium pouzarii]